MSEYDDIMSTFANRIGATQNQINNANTKKDDSLQLCYEDNMLYEGFQKNISELETNKSDMVTNIGKLTNSINIVQNDLNCAEGTVSQLEILAKQNPEDKEIQQKLESAKVTYSTIKAKFDGFVSQKNELTKQLNEVKSNLISLNEQQAQALADFEYNDKEVTSLNKTINDLNKKLETLKKEQEKVEKEYSNFASGNCQKGINKIFEDFNTAKNLNATKKTEQEFKSLETMQKTQERNTFSTFDYGSGSSFHTKKEEVPTKKEKTPDNSPATNTWGKAWNNMKRGLNIE